MPKITVIVPVYGTEPYLPACLDAILAQTHRNLEILLIDDGSPDGCGAICDGYAARDGRIRVFHQPNRGQAAARNVGLEAMTGEFVAFIDSDDLPEPNMLEAMLAALEKTGAEVAVCNIRRLPGGICPIRDSLLTREEFLRKLTEPEAWFYAAVANKLYRRAVFDHIRFPEGFIHEDEAVLHRIAAAAGRFVTLSAPLYGYRRHAGSTMGRGVTIRTTDKLSALSDRLVYSRRMGWKELLEATAFRYAHTFFDLYFRFPRTGETELYFKRMEESLQSALPILWQAKSVSLAHKIYLTLIRIHPRLYVTLRKWKRGDAI